MHGIASNHYPIFVFQEKEKRLFNPINKKSYVIRPEELVRLQWIEAILYDLNWNKTRIACEQSVLTAYQTQKLRADILLFNSDFTPSVLIECKANEIPLSDITALQAGLYNTEIKAPFIVLSNGITDRIFEKKEPTWSELNQLPFPISTQNELFNDVDYWINRGFLGKLIDRQAIKPFISVLNSWFRQNKSQVARYRSFSNQIDSISLNHYYAKLPLQVHHLFGSVLSQTSGKTYFILIQQEQKSIKAIGILDLDAVFASLDFKIWIHKNGKRSSQTLSNSLIRLFQNGEVSSTTLNDFISLLNLA